MRINIVGAGIMGATLAYELGKRGHAVTVIEADKFGRATSAAAGMICPWITKRRNKKWYQLARGGAEYYPELVEDLSRLSGRSVDFKQHGAIKLDASKEKINEFYKIGLQKKVAAPEIGTLEVLSPDVVRAKFPSLVGDYYGLWIEGGGRIRGEALRVALLDVAIESFGAVMLEGDAEIAQGQAYLDGSLLPGDLTILANGVWMADSFSGEFPEPIYFQKGELVHLRVDGLADDLPVLMPPHGVYVLPFSEGRVIVGATHENIDTLLDAKFSSAAGKMLVEKAAMIIPDLANAKVIEEHIGFRPFTEGYLPKFGYVDGDQRLLFVNGLGSSGLTVAPYIARELAKIIDGEPAEIKMANYV